MKLAMGWRCVKNEVHFNEHRAAKITPVTVYVQS